MFHHKIVRYKCVLNHFAFFYLTRKLLVALVFLRLVCFSKIYQNWLFDRLIYSIYFFVQFVLFVLILHYKDDDKKNIQSGNKCNNNNSSFFFLLTPILLIILRNVKPCQLSKVHLATQAFVKPWRIHVL